LIQATTNEKTIRDLIQQGFESTTPIENALPPGYSLNEQGLFKIIQKNEAEEKIWICDPFQIEGISRDGDQANWGWYISFFNQDGNKKFVHVPQALIEDTQTLRKLLRSWGLRITTDPSKKYLHEFLAIFQSTKRVRLVSKFGWHHSVFVLPDEVIGTDTKECYCPQETPGQHGYQQQGSAEDWKNCISKYCLGNSRLIFAVSTAFAAPLLEQLGIEGGGFHLEGNSSIGKSIILVVAASVIGNPKSYIYTWRTTDNALESTCLLRNDSLLILDEIGEMDPKILGETAYMIANGSGRKRANKAGDGKSIKKWKTLLLSNGEKTLSAHITEGGKMVKAGQELRIVTIPAEVGHYGAFETIHEFKTSRSFVEILERNAKEYFGTPFRLFLRILTASLTEHKSRAKEHFRHMENILNKYVSNGQIARVAKRFAIIATGGMLATEFGCTAWHMKNVEEAILKCFLDWLKEWGEDTAEERTFCEQIQAFFQRYAGSRFIAKDAKDEEIRTIKELAGYIIDKPDRSRTYLVNRDVFKREICKGIREQKAKEILFKRKWLIKPSNGWLTSCHVPHLGTTDWFYALLPPVAEK
jgi:putative DNA primase/helicase